MKGLNKLFKGYRFGKASVLMPVSSFRHNQVLIDTFLTFAFHLITRRLFVSNAGRGGEKKKTLTATDAVAKFLQGRQ